MRNNDLLALLKVQIEHMDAMIKRLDTAGAQPHPMGSTLGALGLINLAIEDNREEELVTRLYNLVTQSQLALDANINHAGLVLAVKDANETLKKVMP